MKNTYKGVFNYNGQNFELWCKAANEKSAFTIMAAKIATQVHTSSYNVRNYFYNTNRYEISEVKKLSEK